MKGESPRSKICKINSTTKPDWINLPDHLLANVAYRLHTRNDTRRFRGVCKTFQRSIPVPSRTLFPHPSLKIPAPIGPTSTNRGHFLLYESTIYSIEPLTRMSNRLETEKPWLVKIQESETGKVVFKDMLSRYHFKDLSKKGLPKSLNLLQYRFKEISKAYDLELVFSEAKEEACHVECGKIITFFLQKVAVTSCLDVAEVGFSVMALHDGGLLHVWRKGDENWTNIHIGNERFSFEDIIYHKKNFYVLDHTGHTISVDPRTLNVMEVAAQVPNLGFGFKYLLKSNEQLFMIVKCWSADYPRVILEENHDRNQYPVRLSSFKLDEEKCQWVEVMDELEDQLLFVGDDSSFSIPANELPGCKGNSVFLADIVFSGDANDHPGWNVGIFDFKDGTANPIWTFRNHNNIFWPPPMWLNR